MGISDDAACLQACLQATGGDLEAALEILYSKEKSEHITCP